MPLLDIKDLVFRTVDRTILDGISLAIEPSEVLSLLGANGTGKSTLAYLIMGSEGYRPTAGEIHFDGAIINDLKIHERARLGIAMAWQEPVRFEGITVRDYLTLNCRAADPSAFLQLVGLSPAHYLNRMVDRSLSGGERKRIELASLLPLNPKLAILDEPDSGIDMLSTHDIINLINAFKRTGAAVLLITHREEIAMISDRAAQLCHGRIICIGTPEKVAKYYKSRNCPACVAGECHYV